MENRDLEKFLALAKLLHFGRAARTVHVSPSALTRSIQRLENEIGHELFIRDRRTVTLTETGSVFLAYAERVLGEWERCKTLIESQNDEIRGSLSIYSSVTAVYSILSEILKPFQNRYPNVQIKLSTGTVADAIDRVLDGASDCAIAALPDTLPAGIEFYNLVTTPLVFISPIGFPKVPALTDDGSVDWKTTPIITSDRDVSRERQQSWFADRGIRPSIFAEVAGNEAIIAMVSLGFGVGVVPEIVLHQSPMKDRVRVLEVSPPLSPYSVGVVFKSKRQSEPAISAFRDVAREKFSE